MLNSYMDQGTETIAYYHIKDVDRQGRSALSKIVSVEQTTVYGINLFPNPVVDKLQIRASLAARTNLLITITDMAGLLKYRQSVTLEKGVLNKEINVKNWPPQMYLVKIRDMQSGKETVFKLIKM
jgi:hypothetical protein